jgi:hypothetical protein
MMEGRQELSSSLLSIYVSSLPEHCNLLTLESSSTVQWESHFAEFKRFGWNTSYRWTNPSQQQSQSMKMEGAMATTWY